MPRTAKALPSIDPKAIKFEKVADREAAPFAEVTARDELQQMFDGKVRELYMTWSQAGKPAFTRSDLSKPNSGIPRERALFAPEFAEAVKRMLERAASYAGCAIVLSTLRSHTSGQAMYYWAVRDIQHRDVEKANCPVCRQLVSVRADGQLRTHGPRDNRCSGGAQSTNGSGPDEEVETG